jgi:hypothetical protein
MNRWLSFLLCCVLGLALVISGFLIPAYLRAVDTSVIAHASKRAPGFIQTSLELVKARQLGAAQLLSVTAHSQSLVGRGELRTSIEGLATKSLTCVFGEAHPRGLIIYSRSLLEPIKDSSPSRRSWFDKENRTLALEFLQERVRPRCRNYCAHAP